MHDDLAIAIKQAGESFEPPWLDVRAVAKRGRQRWWLTRAGAVTTSLALVAGAAVVVSRVDLRGETRPAVRGPAWEWERIPDSPLVGRVAPSVAWTGDELIVWGGYRVGANRGLSSGAAYDPESGTWEPLPPAPRPHNSGGTTVWTGDEMIVWGGDRPPGYDGLAYDPATRKWRELPPSPYWSLGLHSAVWTGDEMIVWGGEQSGQTSGAAYDPGRDDWRAVPEGPLGSRFGHEAAWVGDGMLVWGGTPELGTPVTTDTAAFDPVTRNWVALDQSPLPQLSTPAAVWTGNELVVAGGRDGTEVSREAAAWAPVDGWREIAPVPVAPARDGAPIPLSDLHTTPVWTGSEAVFVTADGVLAYDPRTDVWSTVPAPRDAARIGATAAWTGDALIVWSGRTWDGEDYSTGGWIARS